MTCEADMTLLRDFTPDVDPAGWLVSEKFRGIRAMWDGSRFWTRGGEPIPAPENFTQGLPGVPLDGELWAGREPVETKARLAVQYGGRHWTKDVHFVVFDTPGASGPWRDRLRAATALRLPPVAQVVRPVVCRGVKHLRTMLRDIVTLGGEGLVIRHPTATGYRPGRSSHALRVTPMTLNTL